MGEAFEALLDTALRLFILAQALGIMLGLLGAGLMVIYALIQVARNKD